MEQFPLIAKWASRKLATLALFLVFVSNTDAPPTVRVVAATIVSAVFIVVQGWIDRYNPRPEEAPDKPPDDTQEFTAVR